MQAFDNDDRAAYYIPSTHPFVDSEAVRQRIHEREDEYRDTQDYEDPLPQEVLLILIEQKPFAIRSGSNQLVTR